MATSLPNAGKSGRYGDLKKRLLFLLGALLVFRVGAHIPVPGIDPNQLQVDLGDDGSADLTYIEVAARQIGPVLPAEAVVVNKSTVPVGSTRAVERVLGRVRGVVDSDEPGISQNLHCTDIDRDISQRCTEGA